ncbi:hypothetical protein HELRODRAFT_76240 [Helobdella robusta]|uniref:SH3 domain-containing protein n=1 Tax=Helobdella robusta TaxID=6412 RepID=T1G2H3_HELRO|nr:hypothetical protein HELRODRAFT_76240 [Helobdella robusta]ESO07550.1 hypothetical protein HELRODRAFT_76240 [Helobdella robusta]
MSPNPDASEVELKFREGQIIKIYGKKDEDGFFVGEAGGRRGLVPCNMVSEVQVDDPIVVDELLQESKRQINCSVLRANSEFSSRAPSVDVQMAVALYDYNPHELSPNDDVEQELSFRKGDLIGIVGDVDDDGFYYGRLNDRSGLVPSNFIRPLVNQTNV